jgi:biotin transport system substrate-specific component
LGLLARHKRFTMRGLIINAIANNFAIDMFGSGRFKEVRKLHEISKQSASSEARMGAFVLSPTARHILIRLLGSILFAGLFIVGAHIRIPLQPVPITLQTLFVLLAGAVLGRGYGALPGALYLSMGFAGLPVFAGGAAGAALFAGPTGGYLIGFILTPMIVGYLINRKRTAGWSVVVFSVGTLIILFCGITYLTAAFTHNVETSLRFGLLPFIPGDILKIFAAASIYKSYTAIRRYRSSR